MKDAPSKLDHHRALTFCDPSIFGVLRGGRTAPTPFHLAVAAEIPAGPDGPYAGTLAGWTTAGGGAWAERRGLRRKRFFSGRRYFMDTGNKLIPATTQVHSSPASGPEHPFFFFFFFSFFLSFSAGKFVPCLAAATWPGL